MYMPGRLRTASRPRSTVILLESYSSFWPGMAPSLVSVMRLKTPAATVETGAETH